MKKYVLSAALLLCGALGAYAQTKGTNSLGLGFETVKNKYTDLVGSSNENKQSFYSIHYANFVKDQVKLGISLSYGEYENNSNTDGKNYGASFLYQRYFPVYKKLYVFVGGEAAYTHSKATSYNYDAIGAIRETNSKANTYLVGVYGGASYFLGKHWELETRILSANAGYGSTKNTTMGYTSKASNFSLKTAGAFTNLGFSINFLF